MSSSGTSLGNATHKSGEENETSVPLGTAKSEESQLGAGFGSRIQGQLDDGLEASVVDKGPGMKVYLLLMTSPVCLVISTPVAVSFSDMVPSRMILSSSYLYL